MGEDYASAKRLVFDGTKLKAYANRNILTKEGIDKKLKNLDKSIAEYLSQLENNDTYDDELEAAREEIWMILCVEQRLSVLLIYLV